MHHSALDRLASQSLVMCIQCSTATYVLYFNVHETTQVSICKEYVVISFV